MPKVRLSSLPPEEAMPSGAAPRIGFGMAVGCAVGSALLYLTGLEWDVYWGDSAQFAEVASTLDLSAHARGYPLMHALTWAGSRLTGSPALAVNLFSLLTSALAVGAMAHAVRVLGGTRFAAVVGAAVLGLSHTFWSYATVAEVYGFHDLFLLIAIIGAALVRGGRARGTALLGLTLGISLLHHRMMLFSAPVLVAWALSGVEHATRASAARRLAMWAALGAVPFGTLAATELIGVLQGARDVIAWAGRVAYGGDEHMGFVMGGRSKTEWENVAYLSKWLLFNVPGAGLLLAGVGLGSGAMRRSGLTWLVAGLLAVNVFFPFRYDWTGDQYAFLSPLYPAIALAAAFGLEAGVVRRRTGWRRTLGLAACLSPPVLYATLAFTSLGGVLVEGLSPSARRVLFLPVGRRAPAAGTWCRERLARVAEGAVLLAAWGDGSVYRYLQSVEAMRPDVRVSIGVRRIAPSPEAIAKRPHWVSIMPIWADERDRVVPGLTPREPSGLYAFD